MVLKLPRGSLQQPQYGRDWAGRVEMWDARAGHRALKRPVTRGIFKQDICCPPSPDQLAFSEGRRQAPFFACVNSDPKWAVPLLRLGAERTQAGCSGPGVVPGSHRQFVTSFSFRIFTAKKGGEPKRGAAVLKFTTGGFTIVHTV